MTKTKYVRKWELNTSDNFTNLRSEDLFVGKCNNILYNTSKTLSKIYTKGYVQCV